MAVAVERCVLDDALQADRRQHVIVEVSVIEAIHPRFVGAGPRKGGQDEDAEEENFQENPRVHLIEPNSQNRNRQDKVRYSMPYSLHWASTRSRSSLGGIERAGNKCFRVASTPTLDESTVLRSVWSTSSSAVEGSRATPAVARLTYTSRSGWTCQDMAHSTWK